MARPSSKKVTRAAQTGGGRTSRGTQGWLYWVVIAVVVVLGVAGVGYSRDQRRDELAAGDSTVPPLAGVDHWHAAYGIYVCDQFVEPITDQRDPEGIHTHADGVIHIHPFVRRAAGRNATLGKFFDAVRLDFSDSEIEVPGGETYTEGDDECDGEPAVMQVKIKGREDVITTDLADIRFAEDRMVMTIAFAPKGAEIPDAPSEPTLDNLSDVEPTGGTPPEGTTETPAGEGTTEVPAGEGTTDEGTTDEGTTDEGTTDEGTTTEAPATTAP